MACIMARLIMALAATSSFYFVESATLGNLSSLPDGTLVPFCKQCEPLSPEISPGYEFSPHLDPEATAQAINWDTSKSNLSTGIFPQGSWSLTAWIKISASDLAKSPQRTVAIFTDASEFEVVGTCSNKVCGACVGDDNGSPAAPPYGIVNGSETTTAEGCQHLCRQAAGCSGVAHNTTTKD